MKLKHLNQMTTKMAIEYLAPHVEENLEKKPSSNTKRFAKKCLLIKEKLST
jgi:hypothetical protein